MDHVGANNLKAGLLLGAFTVLLLYVGQKIAGPQGMLFAFFLALPLIACVFWFSDHILLALYRARPLRDYDDPALYGTVAYLAENLDIPMPRIYLIKQEAANIFAVGRTPAHASIVVTSGLVDLLSKDEMAGVIAHELSHVVHGDTLICTLAATLGGSVSMLANAAQWLFVLGMGSHREEGRNNFLASLLLMVCAPVIALMIQLSVSRLREFSADERGAALCGNPLWLANALRKLAKAHERQSSQLMMVEHNPATAHLFIINPLRSKQWARLFATHPPVGDRIRRLEALAIEVL